MVELWFYSGRLGNCMFMYAFTRILADALGVKASIPRGMDPPQFPQIFEDAKGTVVHTEKYNVGHDLINPRTVMSDNDNMVWFVEKNFTGGKAEGYKDQITINKILSTPDIYKKWLVILGNFELGENYYPYRNKLKQWFKFPEIDMSKIEFFKLHPELGNTNWFRV